MKMLVIASSIGDTAPGKVFSGYIKRLIEKYTTVDIISLDQNNLIDSELIEVKNIHPRIKKLSITCLNIDIFDYYLAYKISSRADFESYDVVITMMSAHNFFPLYLGYFLKKNKQSIKWINYCVDAVPAPKGWGLSEGYSNGLIKMIRKFMAQADKIYFSNEVMLEYQLNILNGYFKGESGVLYTLPDIEPLFLPKKEKKEFVLLYTGGIYQARKVDQLLLAVERLVLEGINVKLNFVGTNPNSVDLSVISEEVRGNICFFGYTRDLLPFYEEAGLLIDIDADIENDVFISSKFFNYLMLNRRILCITGKNSPVVIFVKDNKVSNVDFSMHSSSSIFELLQFSILKKDEVINRSYDVLKNIDIVI